MFVSLVDLLVTFIVTVYLVNLFLTVYLVGKFFTVCLFQDWEVYLPRLVELL